MYVREPSTRINIENDEKKLKPGVKIIIFFFI